MVTAAIERVYVWEWPVRMYHWVNFLCVSILVVTGILMGHPLAIQSGREASFIYWFGTVRFIHFATGFVFFFNFVFRIYWGFVGNEYARWRNYIPHSRQQLEEAREVLKVDVLQAKVKPMKSVGHNSVAGFAYFLMFLAFLFQCFTGFGMYAAMSDSWFPKLFSWIVPLMGGDVAARQWHHAFSWFFIIFAMVHVYLVFYHDYVEGRGVISSMAGGWKFIEKKSRK